MGRGDKLNIQVKTPKLTAETLLDTILEDVIKTAAMSFDEWFSLSPSPFAPLAIPVAQGRQYKVTQTGVNAAHELTKMMWLKEPSFRQTILRKEFDKLSFNAIGETVLNCTRHISINDEVNTNDELPASFYKSLVVDYEDNLKRNANLIRNDLDRHIPCNLFHGDQGVPRFSIGPVEFSPRADWINSFITDHDTKVQIQLVETRHLDANELRRQAFMPNRQRSLYEAWSVVSSLKNYEWIATIRMHGHESSQSHNKSSIFVGLAIDVIGLRFQQEDARLFTKPGRQHLFSEDKLATTVDGKFLRGTSVQMPGLGYKPGALVAKMEFERNFFDAAGALLKEYVNGRQTGKGPHLVERWANALFWFGEARRETTDFMAVVNYGCALDGLSGAGGAAKKITKFVRAALNPKAEVTSEFSIKIEEAVTSVYVQGRNKLAHGEVSGLLEDLSEIRLKGDVLLVNLFDVVTVELAGLIAKSPEILTLDENHAYRALETRLNNQVLKLSTQAG